MSLSRLLALLLALGLLALTLPACDGGGDGDDDDTTDDDDTADDDDDDDTDDDDTSPPTFSISGTVTDEAGSPLEGVAVTACSAGTCLLANSGADGSLSIDHLPGDDGYVIHNISFPGGADDAALTYSSFYDIIHIADADVVLGSPLVVPEVDDSVVPADDQAAGTVNLLGGVNVSWPSAIDWANSVASVASPSIGVAEVPEANWPVAIGEANALAAWSFAPFETELEGDKPLPDFTVTVPVPNVTTSDSISFLVAHYAEDISTEELAAYPATLTELEGTVYATADVPVLSLLIAVQQ
jgi:hypothetical protein